MEMLKAIGILLVGFVLLIKGADFFVEGSSNVAKKLRIPSIIVGLTIVAMGTSLPELAVSATASLAGNNAIAISNVVGSNMFNLIVVCGACALFAPLAISKEILKKDFPIAIGCGVLLLVMGIIGMEVCRIDGVVLCILFITYISILVRAALKARAATKDEEVVEKTIPVWLCIIYIVGGIDGIDTLNAAPVAVIGDIRQPCVEAGIVGGRAEEGHHAVHNNGQAHTQRSGGGHGGEDGMDHVHPDQAEAPDADTPGNIALPRSFCPTGLP